MSVPGRDIFLIADWENWLPSWRVGGILRAPGYWARIVDFDYGDQPLERYVAHSFGALRDHSSLKIHPGWFWRFVVWPAVVVWHRVRRER